MDSIEYCGYLAVSVKSSHKVRIAKINEEIVDRGGTDSGECWERAVEELIIEGPILTITQNCINDYAALFINKNGESSGDAPDVSQQFGNVSDGGQQKMYAVSSVQSSRVPESFADSAKVSRIYHGIYNYVDHKARKGKQSILYFAISNKGNKVAISRFVTANKMLSVVMFVHTNHHCCNRGL